MKKLKIFEDFDNYTYNQIKNKIKGFYKSNYSDVMNYLRYTSDNKGFIIPLIYDKNVIDELGFTNPSVNRIIDVDTLLRRCENDRDLALRRIRSYFEDYSAFYSQKKEEIDKYIINSTKITEDQRKELNRLAEDRFLNLKRLLLDMQVKTNNQIKRD